MGLAVGVLIKPAKHLTTLHTLRPTHLPSLIGYKEAAPAAANTWMVDALFTLMGRWGRLSNYRNPSEWWQILTIFDLKLHSFNRCMTNSIEKRAEYVPSSKFQCGAGQLCRPVGLGRHVGPSAIPRKFPAIILGTESYGGNSKEHNYPWPQDYSLYYRVYQRISQPPQETTRHATQPNSRPATWAAVSYTHLTLPTILRV